MRRLGTVVAAVLLALTVLAACSQAPVVERTREPTPSWSAPSASAFVTGRHNDVRYGSNRAQRMDLCYPPSRTATTSAFLLVHGGGWSSGSRSDLAGLCATIARLGFVAATMDYRMFDQSATYADMLADIDLASAAYRDTARADGWPVDKLALLGVSAGAHLALLYAYTREPTVPIGFVVGMSSPTDFLDPAFLAAATDEQFAQLSDLVGAQVTRDTLSTRRSALEAASPAYRATAHAPPTILCHGTKDVMVPYSNAVLLATRLAALGVTHELLTYPNSGHDLAGDPDVNNRFLTVLLEYAESYLT